MFVPDRWRYTEWLDQRGRAVARELYDQSAGPIVAENLAERVAYEKLTEELSGLLDGGQGWRTVQSVLPE